MDAVIWSSILLGLGVLFVVLEVFLPSGGVLSFLAAVSVVAAVIVGFSGGARVGAFVLLAALVLIPAVIMISLRFWPYTPLGNLILIKRSHLDRPASGGDPQFTLKQLVGKRGTAKRQMLPSGEVVIEGQTYEATSSGMPIEPGQAVRVVAVHTNRLVVRPTDEPVEPLGNPSVPAASEDVLSQPIEAFGIDPLDDPLA